MPMRSLHAVTGIGGVLAIMLALGALLAAAGAACAQRLDGFNLIMTPDHPFGGAAAGRAILAARRLGATAIAIIPFLWQPGRSSPDVTAGSDMSDDMLRTAIRQVRASGLSVMVKPHVWVPQSWAGAVDPGSEPAWQAWFSNYRRELERIARIAAEEHAEVLAIGTELARTTHRPEWVALIAAARAAFPRTLTYVAHNVKEAEAIPFWDLLDVVGVTLYPALGPDGDRTGRRAVIRTLAERLDALAARTRRPVIVGEIGLRSAQGAAARPWESAEERAAPVDLALQAEVLADWLDILDRPAIAGVLVWRWFTDPAAGGPADSDFTVQGKPAERILLCAWTAECLAP
jgi:hypothetical protein